MGKNGASEENTVHLSGFDIRRTKEGLDETEVANIISQLVSQRDDLSKRTEHLASLTRLAETTVAEADRMAEEIKGRTLQQANDEASHILDQARTQAEQLARDTRELQAELTGSVRDIVGELITVMDGMKDRLKALQANAEHRFGTPTEIRERPETAASEPESLPEAETEVANIAKKPGIELEILPPLDIMKIMDIVTYLDSLPEIGNTELIPNPERPAIIVSLLKPIPITEMLRTLPEIASATAVETDDESPGKIQIRLSENPVTQKA